MGASLHIVFKLIKLYLAAVVPGGSLEQLNDITEEEKMTGVQAETHVFCTFPGSTDVKHSVSLSS